MHLVQGMAELIREIVALIVQSESFRKCEDYHYGKNCRSFGS